MIDQSARRPDWLDESEYPFASHYLEVGPGRMHYIDEGPVGAEETLLFVHGNPDWSFAYRHLIKGLAVQHRCVAVDHIGFGLSDKPNTGWNFTPAEHAAHLKKLVQMIDLRGVTLVVNDWGGPFALPFAADEPDRIRRLVVINSTFWSVGPRELAPRIFSTVMGSPVGRYLVRRHHFLVRGVMRSLIQNPIAKSDGIWRHYLLPATPEERRASWSLPAQILRSGPWFDFQWARRGALQSKPALIVWGSKDTVMPRTGAEQLLAAFPEASVLRLPLSGHYPHEDQPGEVIAAIERLLEKAEASSGNRLPS